ncbi:ABC transporter permease [Eggerthella sinensis]|uniref:ABC transporter permease n=1 Tax=Eggerthella sinensis TaxID=242230 RepID=UPI0022E5F94F|nr:FtsX-like permease family protein [Eggerthella sinensis]
MKLSTPSKPLGAVARAARSTARHPLRTFLLFGLVTAIACLLCAGSALLTASVKTQTAGRDVIPATYRLELDIGNLRERLAALPPEYNRQVGNGSWGTDLPDNAFQSVLPQDVDALASVEGIARASIESVPVPALPQGFERIEDPRRDQTGDPGGVNVVGVGDGELDPNIAAGNVVLAAGSWIEPGDDGKVVVSQDLAEANGLSVGDRISLVDAKDPEAALPCAAEIKGIFEIVHEMPTTMTGDTYRSENTLFSDLALSQRIAGREDDPLYAFAVLQVADSSRYDAVGDALRDADVDWARYALVDDSGASARMSRNFEGLASVTYLFMAVVAVCGLLLIVLSLAFWTKNRMHETAVLLSLGFPRRSPVGQIALEACTIALAGCLAAALVAAPVAQGLASSIIAGHIEQAAREAEADAARTAGAEGLESETFQEANAQITWQNVAVSTAGVELMTIAAVLASAVPAACRKPRCVLTDAA